MWIFFFLNYSFFVTPLILPWKVVFKLNHLRSLGQGLLFGETAKCETLTESPPAVALQESILCYPPTPSRHRPHGSRLLRSLTWSVCVRWTSESQTPPSPPVWWVLPKSWPHDNVLHPDPSWTFPTSYPLNRVWSKHIYNFTYDLWLTASLMNDLYVLLMAVIWQCCRFTKHFAAFLWKLFYKCIYYYGDTTWQATQHQSSLHLS